MGITLLLAETGKKILYGNENYELNQIQKQDTLDKLIDRYTIVDSHSNNLIKNLLKLDYRDRFDYEEILTHPYLIPNR